MVRGRVSVLRASLFFLRLRGRGCLCRFEGYVVNAKHSKCLSAAAPCGPFPIACYHALFREITALMSVIARSRAPQPLCSWFSQGRDGAIANGGRLVAAGIKRCTLLRLFPRPVNVNWSAAVSSYFEDCLSCAFFRGVRRVEWSNANVDRFIFPVFCEILPGRIQCGFR